jgi:hypothetical protein
MELPYTHFSARRNMNRAIMAILRRVYRRRAAWGRLTA